MIFSMSQVFIFYDFMILCILLFYQQNQYRNMQEAIFKTLYLHEETEEALEKNLFDVYLDQTNCLKAHCNLYPNYILLNLEGKDKAQMLRIKLDFDLTFEFLREEGDKHKLGKPIGFKFQRGQKTIVLKNEINQRKLFIWREILIKKLNQRGFHQLFKPIKKIGKGNFATVYLVKKIEDNQKYAVKAFSKEATYSEQFGKQSLVNQIQLMRKFNHKNLMKIYEVYQSQNSIYISVELLQGGQLYDKIKSKYKFTTKELKTIMKGILQGLQYMNSKKIMHRDLKPQNILFRRQGDFDCVIADFGLAQEQDKQYMFVRCGTPGYVAPQIVNLKDTKTKYGSICDIFSAGIIFHLLALRKSPFPGRQYNDVLSQNKTCKINFENQQYSNLPQAWLDLLKRMLEKDPSKRISASEALNHDFFSKDETFKEFNQKRRSVFISEQCDSPLMLTKNRERKKFALLKDDSCLKFKMKENLLSGRTDQTGQQIEQIDSPAVIKKKAVKVNESRFKRNVNNL